MNELLRCPNCQCASLTKNAVTDRYAVYTCQNCGKLFTHTFRQAQHRQGGDGQQGGEHYKGKIDPWELQRTMQTSGNAFVDARRADAIKYAWRNKEGKLLEDLRKARHCIDAAIQELENNKHIVSNEPAKVPPVKLPIVNLKPREGETPAAEF